MAYNRIHPVKATVHKTIDYICDPLKTFGGRLVSSYSCTPETARYEFRMALSRTESPDVNKAYHLIQSFAEGEVSYKEAHPIGIELADALLGGDYSYIVATHMDKDHPHNHILFCAANNRTGLKFNNRKKTLYQIRYISDRLCEEHGLSVIRPGKVKGKSYTEWKAEKEGKAWKAALVHDIDEAVKSAESYEELIQLLKGQGYEIRGSGIGEDKDKYISYKAPGQKWSVNGCYKVFGWGYSRGDLIERIERKLRKKKEWELRKKDDRKDILKRTSVRDKLIDISGEKFKNSPGLEHWAKIQNLKTAAAAYAEAGSISELKDMISDKKLKAEEARTGLVALEGQLRSLKELRHYAGNFKENRRYHDRYKASSDKERYFRMHESEIILYDGAVRKLKQMGLKESDTDLAKIDEDIRALEEERLKLKTAYAEASGDIRKLEQKLQTINDYLGRENVMDEPGKTGKDKKKTEPSL